MTGYLYARKMSSHVTHRHTTHHTTNSGSCRHRWAHFRAHVSGKIDWRWVREGKGSDKGNVASHGRAHDLLVGWAVTRYQISHVKLDRACDIWTSMWLWRREREGSWYGAVFGGLDLWFTTRLLMWRLLDLVLSDAIIGTWKGFGSYG